MMIKKTDQDQRKIEAFTKSISNLFIEPHYLEKRSREKNPEAPKNSQMLFDELKDELHKDNGSLYLCFNCGGVFNADEIEAQDFYQISRRRWHPCMGEISGASYPTPGIFTRWNIILDYLKKKKIFQ